MTTTDPAVAKAQRRGDFWKRRFEHMQTDRDRADKALAAAEQHAAALNAILDRVQQMATCWEQQLPETIRIPAVVNALRAALEMRSTAPPLDHRQILDRAVAHLRSIPVNCTALTGPVWYGQGWQDVIGELEEFADRVTDAAPTTP
ncbi:hypothetical protein [Streptomyces jumonjinensis]|uniref:Uncharacterized protein n=1 Tax=Streptomyces jumonjinensis TaxID=1945 RepID=A0A646KM45_STRJU|nr:hypothetical protein [Streptomyces jumonjinensis]MQT03138.1 hypothetical protein [Streptomyces jumonjinensis]